MRTSATRSDAPYAPSPPSCVTTSTRSRARKEADGWIYGAPDSSRKKEEVLGGLVEDHA